MVVWSTAAVNHEEFLRTQCVVYIFLTIPWIILALSGISDAMVRFDPVQQVFLLNLELDLWFSPKVCLNLELDHPEWVQVGSEPVQTNNIYLDFLTEIHPFFLEVEWHPQLVDYTLGHK